MLDLADRKSKHNLDYKDNSATDKIVKELLLSHVTNSEIED